MGVTASLLIVVAAASPSVEIATLQGQKHVGTLQQITSTTAEVSKSTGAEKLPLKELMSISFPKAASPAKTTKSPIVVTLTDGSRFLCSQVTASDTKVTLESASVGKVAVPLNAIAHIRFTTTDTTLDAKWKAFCDRKLKKDYLVIAKPPALDHLDGVVGKINETDVTFSLGTNTIPVKRSRVFGVIFAPKDPPRLAKAVCRADLTDSNSLQLSSVQWDGQKFTGRLLTGASVELPIASLKTLDFSLGKIQYLSAMEPREVKFTSLYNDPADELLFRYRRNKTFENKPLQLGEKKYTRGLWIYSRTLLKYRLGKDYRRFQATMGIDANAKGNGNVHVVISADGKVILEADVKKGDKPRLLDLNVADIRELEILVDYGQDNNNSGDHLDLVEARVLK
jgi:hypothetical protein